MNGSHTGPGRLSPLWPGGGIRVAERQHGVGRGHPQEDGTAVVSGAKTLMSGTRH
jgi:hypothetical protein